MEFARELSSETDPRPHARIGRRAADSNALHSIHVAVFLREDDRFRLHNGRASPRIRIPDYLDLSFLSMPSPNTPYYFFERTRLPIDVIHARCLPTCAPLHCRSRSDLLHPLHRPWAARSPISESAGRDKGDFLSSDDLELLVTLSGYVAIAIENSRLYSSLQEKVEEYERLKEFSENIVESINVGIMAVDLHDRVESWNSQIEKLTGIPRHIALGRSLRQLFPEDMADRFDEVKGQTGIHNLYKVAL